MSNELVCTEHEGGVVDRSAAAPPAAVCEEPTDRRRGWGSTPVGFVDDVPDTPRGATAAAARASVGAKQRLRIRVPDVHTQITLGHACRGVDDQGFSFPGFGVETDGHVFIHARKDASSSTVTVQAKGDVVIQSQDGRLYAGAQGDSHVASSATSFLMGGEGVVIAGGAPLRWADNPDPDGTQPRAPGWLGGFGVAGARIGKLMGVVDGVAAIGTGVRALLSTKLAVPRTWGDAVPFANLALGNVAGAAASLRGAAGADTVGGTVIYGANGVVVGSTHTLGLYSATGTALISALGITQLAPSIGITGYAEASLDSKRRVDIKSGATLSAVGQSEVRVASRRGSLDLLGRTITVGRDPTTKSLEQDAAERVAIHGRATTLSAGEIATVSGQQLALLTSDKAVEVIGLEVGIHGPKRVSVSSNECVTVSSNQRLRLGVADASLVMKPGQLHLGIGPKLPDAPERPRKGRGESINDFEARLQEHAAALQKYDDQCARAKEANDSARLVFKPGKVEFQVSGAKIRLAGDKVKSGGLVWT